MSTSSTHRRVLSINQAASTSCPDNPTPKTKLEMIEYHASMRVQTIAAALQTYSGVAVRSSKPPANVDVTIRSAHVQVGRAHISGFHAAHAMPGRIDENRIAGIRKEIIDEKVVTPIKEKTLLAAGLTQKKIDKLKKDPSKADKVLENKENLIDGAEGEKLINGVTEEVPLEANIYCDKFYENACKDAIAEVFLKVMQGTLTAMQGTRAVVKLTKKHFKACIENTTEQIDHVYHNKAPLPEKRLGVPSFKEDKETIDEYFLKCIQLRSFYRAELKGTTMSRSLNHLFKETPEETRQRILS